MLLKLLPDQIATYWPYIKYAAVNSLPEGTTYDQQMIENALENLLTDEMQCWWMVEDEEDVKLRCIIVTSIFYDNITRKNILRVSNAFGFLDLSKELWEDALMTLVSYAKHRGCSAMDAFTNNPAILRVGELLKATKMDYLYVELENGHG
jgi:hypothetical protein